MLCSMLGLEKTIITCNVQGPFFTPQCGRSEYTGTTVTQRRGNRMKKDYAV